MVEHFLSRLMTSLKSVMPGQEHQVQGYVMSSDEIQKVLKKNVASSKNLFNFGTVTELHSFLLF